ncbi:fibronectin type III domain-containing protein [Trueperella pyogenes]|uniref:fibronectin type III domain-containing protein n=1 Tax=Trueperella pyogenes TaxID=1661 RepID=UPI00117F67EA|nr:fibronectin type III domain-containing protein [Trueperella pyogenes]
MATTKDGDSSPVSPIYEKVRLTGSPADPKIEVSTSTGLKLDELDPAKDIGNLPVAPRNTTLTRVGEGKMVRVAWEVPQDDWRITGYRVELYKDGESNPVTFRQVGKNNKYLELPISDDCVYTASVRSEIRRNDDLSATPLRSMPAKTDQLTISAKDSNKPKAVPETPKKPNLRLALKDAKALEAFLFPPESTAGKISNYEIELFGDGKHVKTLKADMTAELPEVMKISDLQLGATYSVRVRAENAQGWSPWSEESNKVTIPANQDEFAMTPPKEVFVLVDTETSTAKIRWIKSDYEPKDACWHVRIECVQDCPAGSEPITGIQPIGVTGIDFANLKPGVYQASLTLVNGQKTSKPVKSDKFAVGVPAVVPNPKITVTPTSNIDSSVNNVFTVNGTGYLGTSASKGVYVVVADPTVWTPGERPKFTQVDRFVASIHVKPAQIVNGVFTAKIEVPAGKFDPKKSYVVGTMAAHQLSITDRSMDAGKAISFASSGQPEAKPKPSYKPKPEATQPEAKQLQTKPQPEVMSAKVDSSKVVTPAKKLAFTGAQAMTLFVASLVMVILGAAVVVIRRLRR